MAGILVIAELNAEQVLKTTLSAITFAREAASILSTNFSILAIGKGASQKVASLVQFGAKQVLVADIDTVDGYVCEHFSPTVAQVAKDFSVIVATASAFGKDLMPRVAAAMQAGYAADIVQVLDDGGKLLYKRPMYAGNVFGYMQIHTPVQVVTVRQSDFAPAQPVSDQSPVTQITSQPPSEAAARITFLGFDQVKSERPNLTEAQVVVSGGRACKDKFFDVLGPLADVFAAAIGATRAACDGGYAPSNLQVGQTGKIVAPELYFAIGLSGAIQHLAGMKGSKVIVAINRDPDAPIFSVADYGLVADLFQAVPELVQAVKEAKA